jgi:6-phosphofructokinase 1
MAYDFRINTLGEAKITSPIELSTILGDKRANYVRDDEYILYDINGNPDVERPPCRREDLLEPAGPRETIYFNPAHVHAGIVTHVHAGIVTCGGLCPGLNNVIRAIVRCLWYQYGVRRISGIRNGYKGLLPDYHLPPLKLDPEMVDDIHTKGGTLLGTSRGSGEIRDIVDSIERMNLNIFFTVGGDGTQKGALRIAEELERRGLKIAVVGIPKTIDNDLSFVQRSFGFETAVSRAEDIAVHTALAMSDVNFILIPEIPFDLEGENGLFVHLEKRLIARNHAVILVAEGAGQHLFDLSGESDKSGNPRLIDIGVYLREAIKEHFENIGMEITLKYIDPSYMIRSAPANPNDSIYCSRLGTSAVHAAMAGKTKMIVSLMHERFVHIPIKLSVAERNSVDPEGSLWRDVLEATRQPAMMVNNIT